MEGERSSSGLPSYELHVSFSAATPGITVPIHEMGFVQFDQDHDHHNHNVLSFLSPSTAGQLSSSSTHQPLNSTAAATAEGDKADATAAMGFCHGDLVSRPSWNNEQTVIKIIRYFFFSPICQHFFL